MIWKKSIDYRKILVSMKNNRNSDIYSVLFFLWYIVRLDFIDIIVYYILYSLSVHSQVLLKKYTVFEY